MYGWMHLRTGEETGRLTDYGRITNRKDKGQTYGQACVRTDGHPFNEQRDWGLEGQMGGLTDRQTDIQAGTDRQTGGV